MNLELRDPHKLRPHKLHTLLPAPDETTPAWYSFSDNLQANGPDECPPIIVTGQGFVMDGWRRVLVARARQWPTIRCEMRDDDKAALIIVESLFGQRDMSRGAKVYFSIPLMTGYVDSSEVRRQANLKLRWKTNEKPLIYPNPSDSDSESAAAEICARLGVSWDTLHQASQVRDLMHDPEHVTLAEWAGLKPGSKELRSLQVDLQSEFEPQLASGAKGLWFVHSAIAGRFTTKDKERPIGDAEQLEFWSDHLQPLINRMTDWKRLPKEVRLRALNDIRTLVSKLPEADRRAMLEEFA